MIYLIIYLSLIQLSSDLRKHVNFRDIQQILVEIGDKDPSFIGSREWIGAIELSFVLDKLLGVSMLFYFTQKNFTSLMMNKRIMFHNKLYLYSVLLYTHVCMYFSRGY